MEPGLSGTLLPGIWNQVCLELCYLGYGTRFVWNSVRSTFNAPSNLNDAVMLDTIWLINLKKKIFSKLIFLNFIKIWPVKIAVWRSLNVQVPFTDIIDCLVVYHKGAIWVLQGGVGSQDRVVRFNHSSSNLQYKNVYFFTYFNGPPFTFRFTLWYD